MKTGASDTEAIQPSKKKIHAVSGAFVLVGALTAGLLSYHPEAHAALTFTFNYSADDIGFSDATYGAERRAALEAAANDLGSYFTAYNANIEFYVISENDPESSTLASAGSSFNVIPGTFQQSVVQTKILTDGATDPNGSAADGNIYWNFGSAWDSSDNVSTDKFDLKSTAMHELLHAFGFASMVGNGGTGLQNQAPGTPDTWTMFDSFLTDADGNPLIGSDGVFQLAEVDDLAGGTGDNGVFFSGPNAMAANGGNRVNLYSPEFWEPGSSISHLDDDAFISQTLLMEAAAETGIGARTLSAIELGILKDIGYTKVAPVPVPAAIWLMGTGLLMLFGMRRRRRSSAI